MTFLNANLKIIEEIIEYTKVKFANIKGTPNPDVPIAAMLEDYLKN